MIRLLVADDHEIFRRGLRDLLRDRLGSDLELGEAKDSGEAVNLLMSNDWDLLLLDINMPHRGGLEVLEEIRRLRLKTRVLILSSYPEEQYAVRAFKLGAAGYVNKQSVSAEVITAIRQILAGKKYVTPSQAERLVSSMGTEDEAAPHEILSQRELEVLRLIALGKSTKEIANELVLSEKTVGTYRLRIVEKTGMKTSVEMARYSLKQGLVD